MTSWLSFACDELSNKESSLGSIIRQITRKAALCFSVTDWTAFLNLSTGKCAVMIRF